MFRKNPENKLYNLPLFDYYRLMKITRQSMFSGKTRTLDLDISQFGYDQWMSGKLIQEALPDLSTDEREFLISGVTSEEWQEYLHVGE
tara:strand:- start:764 stop:1027 length:264 start_codon:yes stop_codon:yes gene_type:complete